MPLLLGIDTGGTFTDAVLFDEDAGVVGAAKALTTRQDLAVGIANALDEVIAQTSRKPSDIALVSLSTTLATNALVEGQGGRVCLVLIGFEEAALQRADLADALKSDPVLLIAGGHDAHGEPQAEFDRGALLEQLKRLEGQVSGFAVAAQFAVRNPAHEVAARDLIIESTGRPVTCSHELSSRLDGPRRALTCVLNARLINLIHHLISAASALFESRGIEAPIMVVRGDGALISAEVAQVKPIETILSGPAASLVGAAYLTNAKDAIVSDIGGTTTDFAVLSGGRPKLDANGATVGGWRTMVEAVAINTIGLGGDSEVQVINDGLSTTLKLGPRRMVPLSLMALEHRALVLDTLERQLTQPRPEDLDGRFAFAIDRQSAHLAAMSTSEQALLDTIRKGPLALDKLIQSRVQISVLNRLVSHGLVMLSAMTPSDAAHVLGLHDAWNNQASTLGARLFARKRTGAGKEIAADEAEVSRNIVNALIDGSALTLLGSCLEKDGFSNKGLARELMDARAPGAGNRLTDFTVRLTVPVIGLGASAPTYYPRVAEQLSTTALIPEHAGVANAVGAVVGQIRVRVEASISQPEQGRYRVYSHTAPKDFASFEDAYGFAEAVLTSEVRVRAGQAGAGDVEIRLSRNDKTATIEGKQEIIESQVVAVAAGRPNIAE